jgi:hypothetical protein
MLGCSNSPSNLSNQTYPFEFEGVIQKPGVTAYMYGSHTISNNGKMYALQSTSLNLDLYLNKTVTVKGSKVPGYPLEGGPDLIDVKAVEKK